MTAVDLMNGFVTQARHARADNLVDHKTPGNIFGFLVDIFAKCFELAAVLSSFFARRLNVFMMWHAIGQ